MTFTEDQLKTLSAWEEHFRTAVNARWARNPGRTALRVIWDIYTSATGDRRRFSDNCSSCILHLLQDCGTVYYRDIEELARRRANKAVSAHEDAPAEVIPKVKVKTAKKAGKKTKTE